MPKKIVKKITNDVDRNDVLCTTYQMRNFYTQFKDGFFSNLDVMNYIQHHAVTKYIKKGMKVVDVCCGRSLVLPLLRWYNKNIESYTGIDISKTNIEEAKRGSSKRIDLANIPIEDYYPFKVNWIQANVAEMSKYIKPNSCDFLIYTSSLEHMHKDDGKMSLEECYSILKENGKMFLSCPNTKGNGYNTQYAAHVYEWGYEELKNELENLGFEIIQEVGLIMKAKKMKEFFNSNNVSDDIKNFYKKLSAYLPTTWLTPLISIPYPEISDEILFIVKKVRRKGLINEENN